MTEECTGCEFEYRARDDKLRCRRYPLVLLRGDSLGIWRHPPVDVRCGEYQAKGEEFTVSGLKNGTTHYVGVDMASGPDSSAIAELPAKCPGSSCVYSRAIDQPRPRKCQMCGREEVQDARRCLTCYWDNGGDCGLKYCFNQPSRPAWRPKSGGSR